MNRKLFPGFVPIGADDFDDVVGFEAVEIAFEPQPPIRAGKEQGDFFLAHGLVEADDSTGRLQGLPVAGTFLVDSNQCSGNSKSSVIPCSTTLPRPSALPRQFDLLVYTYVLFTAFTNRRPDAHEHSPRSSIYSKNYLWLISGQLKSYHMHFEPLTSFLEDFRLTPHPLEKQCKIFPKRTWGDRNEKGKRDGIWAATPGTPRVVGRDAGRARRRRANGPEPFVEVRTGGREPELAADRASARGVGAVTVRAFPG